MQSNCTDLVFISKNEQQFTLDKILPNIYIGNVEAAKDLSLLKKNNIKNIINVTDDKQNFFENNFVYFRVAIKDRRTKSKQMSDYVPKVIKFIDECEGNILIHCNAGTSRSATILLCYIMYSLKLSLKESFQYVIERRTKNTYTHPNIGFFTRVLIPFEKKLFNSNSFSLNEYNNFSTKGKV